MTIIYHTVIITEPTSRPDRTNLEKRTKSRREHLTSQKESFPTNQTLRKSRFSNLGDFYNDVNIFYIIDFSIHFSNPQAIVEGEKFLLG